MGSPLFAVSALDALHADPRTEVTLVVSQPDRPSGRGKRLRPPEVAARAHELGLPTFQPESLKTDESYARLAAEEADLFVVAAYGQILRQRVLDLPQHGCVNIHASLLPRWRGAAPIHWSVATGDGTTGVSIMRMERGLDTGPVYRMESTMIGATETTGELHDRLATMGARLLMESLDDIADPHFIPTPQADDRATYARMLSREDRRVDFSWPAARVAWHINGMNPWPGVAVTIEEQRISLLRARVGGECGGDVGTVSVCSPEEGLNITCGDGRMVEVLEVKRAGKRAMSARDLACGCAYASLTPVVPVQ